MFTKEFSIAMPNEPLKNDFSDNATITGTYKGPRYIKIEYNNETKIVGNWIDEGDAEAEHPFSQACAGRAHQARHFGDDDQRRPRPQFREVDSGPCAMVEVVAVGVLAFSRRAYICMWFVGGQGACWAADEYEQLTCKEPRLAARRRWLDAADARVLARPPRERQAADRGTCSPLATQPLAPLAPTGGS